MPATVRTIRRESGHGEGPKSHVLSARFLWARWCPARISRHLLLNLQGEPWLRRPAENASIRQFSQYLCRLRRTVFPTLLNAACCHEAQPTEMEQCSNGAMERCTRSPQSHRKLQRARRHSLVIPHLYCFVLRNELNRSSRTFPLTEIRLGHSTMIVGQLLEMGVSAGHLIRKEKKYLCCA